MLVKELEKLKIIDELNAEYEGHKKFENIKYADRVEDEDLKG